MSRRLEPTVFLAMISPLTVGLLVGTVALVRLVSESWALAVLAAVAVWITRVLLAVGVARKVRGLERRIDPFALREPWRFFVRDALSARQRFSAAVAGAEAGPLFDRLREIEERMERAVTVTWEVAQRGQQLTDARRRIDLVALDRVLGDTAEDDPRHRAALAQRQSHDRLRSREEQAQERLEILDAQLDETIVRASELATRTGGSADVETLAAQVSGMVDELDSLRIALDEVGDGS